MLLDNFIQASASIEEEEQRESARKRKEAARISFPLDPLLERLADEYTDDADLSTRLQDLFTVLPLCSNQNRALFFERSKLTSLGG